MAAPNPMQGEAAVGSAAWLVICQEAHRQEDDDEHLSFDELRALVPEGVGGRALLLAMASLGGLLLRELAKARSVAENRQISVAGAILDFDLDVRHGDLAAEATDDDD